MTPFAPLRRVSPFALLLAATLLAPGCPAVDDDDTVANDDDSVDEPGPIPPAWPDTIPKCDDFVAFEDPSWACFWGWREQDLCADGAWIPERGTDGGICPDVEEWLGGNTMTWSDFAVSWLARMDFISPATQVNFMAIFPGDAQDTGAPIDTLGFPCNGATDDDACEAAYAGLLAGTNGVLGQTTSGEGGVKIAYTRGDEVGLITGGDDETVSLLDFLSPISSEDAVFLTVARYGDYGVRDEGKVQPLTGGGAEMYGSWDLWDSPRRTDQIALRVDDAGDTCVFAAHIVGVDCGQ